MRLAREAAARTALVVVSILLSLAVLELSCRVAAGSFWLKHWPNLVLYQLQASHPEKQVDYIYDKTLGFLPRPGFTSPRISFDADGYRLTPGLPPDAPPAPPVLVTGASFAESDEVDDADTWPALFQARIGRHVINAGVVAFGLDQVVMRTEQVSETQKPAAIVVIVTADGLWRSEVKQLWGAPKPYFTLNDKGALALHNVPVPEMHDPQRTMSSWQRIFGWSKLVATILERIDGHDAWISGNVRATPSGTGERLACPLMQHLAALGVPTLVVALYEPLVWRNPAEFQAEHRRLSQLMLDCADAAGLATLDLFAQVDRAVQARGVNALFLTDHHSAEGYRLVADAIAAEFERLKY